METWHVYQLRSDAGLLYVGYTRRFQCRLREHSRQKPWWSEVTDVRSDEFTSEDEARQRGTVDRFLSELEAKAEAQSTAKAGA